MDALFLSALAAVVVLWLYFGHRRCMKCGSRKTFNWVDETRDISHPGTRHTNHNQYCFPCRKMTATDGFGQVLGLRALIAERHSGLRIRHGRLSG